MTVTTTTGARARELKAAAAELVEVAARIKAIGDRACAALLERDRLRSPRSAVRLLRAVTHPRGLGQAMGGGRFGAVLGRDSLAVLLAVTSLRLRISAVDADHPEVFADRETRAFVEAVGSDRDVNAARILRTMFSGRGASAALSALAPIAMEVMAMRALLDENPFNDEAGWALAAGTLPSSEPLLGVTTRAVTSWDRGDGSAERAQHEPGISPVGGPLAFLGNIATLGNDGRILIQEIGGRYVVHAPGMATGRPVNDTPQDLVGAWRNTLLGDSPYVGALLKAIDDFGVPEGAEVALVGHSEGGAAVMNLAQDALFCRRHLVTHVLAVGAPVDAKQCADPATWVASVAGKHDIVPTLDGRGAGSCFAHPEGWYVVEYADSSHVFPQCHNIRAYIANLRDDLPEALAELESRLAPYAGAVTRSQVYRVRDWARPPAGFPFLTVASRPAATSAGEVDLPFLQSSARAVVCLFAVDAGRLGSLQDVRLGRRALVALTACDHREGSAGPYREVSLSVAVHSPWQAHHLEVWRDLLAPPAHRRAGVEVLERALTSERAEVAGRELWGLPGCVTESLSDVFSLRGRLGPGVPVPVTGTVIYSRLGGVRLRSCLEVSGGARLHPLAAVRLRAGPEPHPLAIRLRALGLDGATPLATLTLPAYRSRLSPPVPLLVHDPLPEGDA
ncbi:hypothetical protein OIE66_22470 [Nonomuraea sp. NBC_01738]|uniref:hypothetical protein n=1 Tax=Nonomuraea sp. NBC_01738 TaxID=2976003 RepID=UPI002E103521|nr:hypothetical protein OIE66_22470 [Nonomuraea sp. NBC_01738]